MVKAADPQNPHLVRLKDLKAPLQMWASEDDRSLNYLILRILREAVNKKFGYSTTNQNINARSRFSPGK